jgi:hypothetical protein
MDDAMVELVELGSGSAQARARREVKRRSQGEWEEQGDAHGLLTSSCDDSQARLVRTAVYGIREASEASGELNVLLWESNPAYLFIG